MPDITHLLVLCVVHLNHATYVCMHHHVALMMSWAIYVYMHIYMYTYMYVYTYICIHTYLCIFSYDVLGHTHQASYVTAHE